MVEVICTLRGSLAIFGLVDWNVKGGLFSTATVGGALYRHDRVVVLIGGTPVRAFFRPTLRCRIGPGTHDSAVSLAREVDSIRFCMFISSFVRHAFQRLFSSYGYLKRVLHRDGLRATLYGVRDSSLSYGVM